MLSVPDRCEAHEKEGKNAANRLVYLGIRPKSLRANEDDLGLSSTSRKIGTVAEEFEEWKALNPYCKRVKRSEQCFTSLCKECKKNSCQWDPEKKNVKRKVKKNGLARLENPIR